MKLFFIGGLLEGDGRERADPLLTAASMQAYGEHLAAEGHELIVCSPFQGSLDLEIMRGAARATAPKISIHYPDTAKVRARVDTIAAEIELTGLQRFEHMTLDEEHSRPGEYSWLLAQLAGLDSSHVVIAAGGDPEGSSNLLMNLAEARRMPILPLPGLGGSAELSFGRRRHILDHQLGSLASWLQRPNRRAPSPPS